jgi:hypothetical protein
VLLFAQDEKDWSVPPQYADLLPVPMAELEARVAKGEVVELTARKRNMDIVLAAAPTGQTVERLLDGIIGRMVK